MTRLLEPVSLTLKTFLKRAIEYSVCVISDIGHSILFMHSFKVIEYSGGRVCPSIFLSARLILLQFDIGVSHCVSSGKFILVRIRTADLENRDSPE
jgi:hypothetical protein